MKQRRSSLLQKSPFHLLAAIMVVAGLVGFGYVATRIFAAGSAQLYLLPASGSYTPGSTVAVQVMLNTGGESVNAVQADISYPTSRLQFVSIDAAGSAFDIDASSSGGGGTVNIARGKIGQVTGTALVATVRFSVQSSAGAADLSFLNSSAVVRSSDSTNVLGTTSGATYTVVIPTPTPAPTTPTPATPTPKTTATPGAKTSPTPTSLAKPASTGTPTPAPGGPLASKPSLTPTPTPTAPSSTPAPTKATLASQGPSSALTLAATTGGSALLLMVGLMIWRAAQRRHHLAMLSAPGSMRPYNLPPTPAAPPTPTAQPSTPPAGPGGPPPAQTFYPHDHPGSTDHNPGDHQ